MSVKRPGSPLESMALVPRVEEGAAAAASSEFDRLPDEILDHIFRFLPKQDCKAVSLVDKRMNHVMAEHYANRAILALDHGFTVKVPNFFQSMADEGVTVTLDPDTAVTCKLLVMQRKDHRLLETIHEESIEFLRSFKENKSIKGLARVDVAVSHRLPEITLAPVSFTDVPTGTTHSTQGTDFERFSMQFQMNKTDDWLS